ncbi:sugar-binding protein [uncultured Draconibacterium sp.]|uniref:glucuronyl esterase domain-containing protein n=1 Tax=uncultured Draconibacterium sp. TaxID=1573823 RepID=UPI002AA66E34|nr:sugar-binding protein [uncultured Draconibacterium sp.]
MKAYWQVSFWLFIFLASQSIYCNADTSILTAQFTSEKIVIDGDAEHVWGKASFQPIAKLMSIVTTNEANGTVQSLWDGALLYIFITVEDRDVSTDAKQIYNQDGISVFVDLYNDKFPKYEEDDVQIIVNAKGESRSNGTDAARFAGAAALPIVDSNGDQIGYTVEMAYQIGGRPMENGTEIGFEVGINNADSESKKVTNRIFWSSSENKGLDDNSYWGTIVLQGFDEQSLKALDLYSLKNNLKKAKEMPFGIWQSETEHKQAIQQGEKAIKSNDQKIIYSADTQLAEAINKLRRKGVYSDPYDLPKISHLPDPFTFRDGRRVESQQDWKERAEEIKSLAEYYEYGIMPDQPEKVSATLDGTTLNIEVVDQGKTVKFDARLFLPDSAHQNIGTQYPVIVSIDFSSGRADTVYTNAGYALLSFRYTSVASDNNEHTGPFYELYPYNITSGSDAGTLLAWAWGASRCVDALEYLSKQEEKVVSQLDLNKLVVTGFSRCGKASLLAGLFDDRFGVVSPGASGSGGAAVFRYASFGNKAHQKPPYGNEYDWGTSPGCEVLGDRIRHQGYNANTMLARFLNPGRMYKTNSYGYAERLPYDHHEIVAAIAPRAVLITTAVDDYANNAEGDAISYEGAKPIYEFLGVSHHLGLNIRTTGEAGPFGGGHWLSDQQKRNLIAFANSIFFQKPLSEKFQDECYTNPYLPTFDKYYGGIQEMMPWRIKVEN